MSQTTINIKRVTSFGLVLAMIISWSVNQSILWALLHGIFGWGYVIYYAIKRG